MTGPLIHRLVASDDPVFRDVGYRMLVDTFQSEKHLFFRLLSEALQQNMAPLVDYAIRRFPFLKDNRPCPMPTYTGGMVFGNLKNEFDGFMASLSETLPLMGTRKETLLKSLYRFFPGIRTDLELLYPTTNLSGKKGKETTAKRQLMVFVTGHCNLRCPYCFSNGIEQISISRNDMHRVIGWAATNGVKIITPCGGEPLLYPFFSNFVRELSNFGMTTYFATNGTIPFPDFPEFRTGMLEEVFLHLTSSLWSQGPYKNAFIGNVAKLKEWGVHIVARANIVSEHEDFARWFDLLEELDLEDLNIALVIPDRNHANGYVAPEEFELYVPVLRQILEEARKRRVRIGFAKPIPPCVFGESEGVRMLADERLSPCCNVLEDGAMRNLCLSPDLVFTPCLGLREPAVPFAENLSWDELAVSFRQAIVEKWHKPLFEECHRCFLHSRGMCQGACLSYK